MNHRSLISMSAIALAVVFTAVLLTPAHHSPMGMSLHPSRRTAVVHWAQRTGGYVLGMRGWIHY